MRDSRVLEVSLTPQAEEVNARCNGVRNADITFLSTKQNTHKFFSLPAASFYPGYHGRALIFDTEPGPLPSQNDNLEVEDEEWTDEEDLADLAQQQPGKFNKSIANEVCH